MTPENSNPEIRDPRQLQVPKLEATGDTASLEPPIPAFGLRSARRQTGFRFAKRHFGFRSSAFGFPPCLLALVFSALCLLPTGAGTSGVRIRDLTMVAGARDNQLVGYGLVAGLAGDGDKDPIYTKQT